MQTLNSFQIVEVLSGGELMSVARELDFLPGFAFEGFPNRDSTKYAELYGIQDAHTMFRGTMRYKGTKYLCSSISSRYKQYLYIFSLSFYTYFYKQVSRKT